MDGSADPSNLHLCLDILSIPEKKFKFCYQNLLLFLLFYLFLLLLFFYLFQLSVIFIFSKRIAKRKGRGKRKREEEINKKGGKEEYFGEKGIWNLGRNIKINGIRNKFVYWNVKSVY